MILKWWQRKSRRTPSSHINTYSHKCAVYPGLPQSTPAGQQMFPNPVSVKGKYFSRFCILFFMGKTHFPHKIYTVTNWQALSLFDSHTISMKNLALSIKVTYPFILYPEIYILERYPQVALARRENGLCIRFCIVALLLKAKDWKEPNIH